MKIRKLCALLSLILLLTGCGGASTETPESGSAEEKPETEQSSTLENRFTLSASTDDRGVKSAIITFNTEKVCVSDQNRNATPYTYFDYIGDPNSTLYVRCYDRSAEELYEETKVIGFSKKMQEHVTLTDITEIKVGDLTVKTYASLYKGELHEEHFIIELDNGYVLHNGNGHGYDGNIDFEEMLACVFTKAESGDGTRIRPAWGFEKENDGSALKYTFDSGKIFTLDYAEDVVKVETAGNVIDVEFLDEKVSENLLLEMYVSQKFDSFAAYQSAMEDREYMQSGCAVKQEKIGGFDITYACEESGGSNWINGIWYMELPDGFSIRGLYENCYEDLPISLPDAIGMVLGADVDVPDGGSEQPEEEDDDGEKTLAEIAASFGYTAPSKLDAAINGGTYQIDGVLYRFPTPVSVFLQNGWKIPDTFRTRYDGIQAGNPISIALENENGGIIYNVILSNLSTEGTVTLEEGMVVMMQVTHTSNVKLILPQGLTFDSTLDDLKGMSATGYTDNSPYSTFSWWNESSGCSVGAWYHPEIGLEYFEFIYF